LIKPRKQKTAPINKKTRHPKAHPKAHLKKPTCLPKTFQGHFKNIKTIKTGKAAPADAARSNPRPHPIGQRLWGDVLFAFWEEFLQDFLIFLSIDTNFLFVVTVASRWIGADQKKLS
jgi:hypothetical protein